MNEPIGVLGQSNGGTGVRGHAGPLIKLGPCAPASMLAPVESGLGGVFSSGRLQDQVIPDATEAQTVSLDSLAQVRLTPSGNIILPRTANIGDFYLTLAGGNHNIALLFLCTQITQTKSEKNVPPVAAGDAGYAADSGRKVGLRRMSRGGTPERHTPPSVVPCGTGRFVPSLTQD